MIVSRRSPQLLFFPTRNNLLVELPGEAIGPLQKMKELWCSGNRLELIPPEIGHCVALEEVWLEDNLLRALPPEFVDLKALVRAGFDGNPMETPPIETCHEGVEVWPLTLASLCAIGAWAWALSYLMRKTKPSRTDTLRTHGGPGDHAAPERPRQGLLPLPPKQTGPGSRHGELDLWSVRSAMQCPRDRQGKNPVFYSHEFLFYI